MGKADLVKNNPLRAPGMGDMQDAEKNMGLVIARAGLGKTAILVQIALDSLLRGNKVLHISIGESVDKARAWYDDILSMMTSGQKGETASNMISEIMRNRMIMTFKENAFDRAKLQERIDDLVQQDIFKADTIIVDGFDFESSDHASLQEIKASMQDDGLKTIWFSAVSHRENADVNEIGVPAPCNKVDDLFDSILMIDPDGESIRLNILKCVSGKTEADKSLTLDPATMLIKNN